MKTLSLDLPLMYGDHHVTEVRHILLGVPGVAEVYASSAFRVVEVNFDPAQVDEDSLKAKLDEAGYLGEFELPTELGIPVTELETEEKYFRHSAAFAQLGNVQRFEQTVTTKGWALWPCPGMGPVNRVDEGI